MSGKLYVWCSSGSRSYALTLYWLTGLGVDMAHTHEDTAGARGPVDHKFAAVPMWEMLGDLSAMTVQQLACSAALHCRRGRGS